MRKMKSEHKKTNASRQARSQLHLSEGVATKREQYVTDLTQLQIVPESCFSVTHVTVWFLTTLARKRPWLILRWRGWGKAREISVHWSSLNSEIGAVLMPASNHHAVKEYGGRCTELHAYRLTPRFNNTVWISGCCPLEEFWVQNYTFEDWD